MVKEIYVITLKVLYRKPYQEDTAKNKGTVTRLSQD